ncbi:Hypothetical predicted protein [Olea europaea subsp. europaea]|uniref:Uncharacterized protein n=1 Tax=Olea europaea subsp. europaea TaxID=158383 RepID=A0A8S0RK98_OLEEU|nr:Hypothetical predicted protein [Olea europaea subsp. europaea]
MTLDARLFLRSVIITFKVGRIHDWKFELIAEAIEEKPIDIVLRLGRGIGFVLIRNVVRNRRESAIIAGSLVEFPLNLHQIRARNMCCDIDVVPEAIVNVNTTRAPMRMEGNRQGDVNVVPEVMVNVDTTRALVSSGGSPEGDVKIVNSMNPEK